jgi:hypothetical protein
MLLVSNLKRACPLIWSQSSIDGCLVRGPGQPLATTGLPLLKSIHVDALNLIRWRAGRLKA